MMNRMDKFNNRFQMVYTLSGWLLATCGLHDNAYYLILILKKLDA